MQNMRLKIEKYEIYSRHFEMLEIREVCFLGVYFVTKG